MAFTDSPTTDLAAAPAGSPSEDPSVTDATDDRCAPSCRRSSRSRAPGSPSAVRSRRRPRQVDPFLLLDEMGPVDYAPGQARARPTIRTAGSRP